MGTVENGSVGVFEDEDAEGLAKALKKAGYGTI
jgi:hypothetical protein